MRILLRHGPIPGSIGAGLVGREPVASVGLIGETAGEQDLFTCTCDQEGTVVQAPGLFGVAQRLCLVAHGNERLHPVRSVHPHRVWLRFNQFQYLLVALGRQQRTEAVDCALEVGAGALVNRVESI